MVSGLLITQTVDGEAAHVRRRRFQGGIHPQREFTYQFSELVTKNTKSKLIDIALLDAVHGAYLYDFNAFPRYSAPTYKAETATVQAVLNSIQLAR